MMKKVLSIALALALCLTAMMGCFVVSADSANTLAVGTANITVGDAASVDVTLTSEGVWALRFDVVSDAAVTAVAIDDANFSADLEGSRVLIQAKDNAYATNLTNATITLSFGELAVGEYNVAIANIDAGNYAESAVAFDTTAGKIVVAEAVVEPSCDHENLTPSAVADGKLSYVCDDCGETVSYTIAAEPYGTNTGISSSILPTNDISMYFYFRQSRVTAFSNLALLIEKPMYDDNDDVVAFAEYLDLCDIGGNELYHGFTFADIAAYEMSTEVALTLYGINAEGEAVLLKTSTYSVVSYVEKAVQTPPNAKFVTAMYDLLNYGSYVQKYANYNTDNLANAGLTAEQLALATPYSEYEVDGTNLSKISGTTRPDTTTEAGRVSVSKSVYPGSKVFLEFVMTTFGGDINNYHCYYDYYDHNGNAQVSDYYAFADSGIQFQGYDTFQFDMAPVSTISYPVTIHVFYGDPENGGVEVINTPYSIETYIKTMLDDATQPDAFKDMLRAMYAYGVSLADYASIPEYVAP